MLNKQSPIGFVLVLFIVSCAQIKPIPGGDKDLVPPQIVKWIPENTQTNFTAKGFSIEFDEYITLQNIQTELVVSPPLQSPPEVSVAKKRLTVRWKEELAPNTTYNFQFGDGVADINEGNKVPQLNYVFSTGAALDSASSRFQVIDNLTGEPSKNIRIILFENDTAFFEARPKPAYVSKTNDKGFAQIKYMRPSQYYVYALDDANGNYRPDDGEWVGFLAEPIAVTSSDSSVTSLRLCAALPETKRVENYMVDSTGTLRFYWPKPWGKVNVNGSNGLPIQTWIDQTNDTIWAYLQGSPTDSYGSVYISDDLKLRDTISIPFFKQQLDRWKFVSPSTKIKPGQPLVFSAPFAVSQLQAFTPLIGPDSSKIEGLWSRGVAPHQVLLSGNFKPGKYTGQLLPGAFANVSGITNDSLKFEFQVLSPKDLGTLQIDLSGLKEGRIYYLEMINAQGTVVQTWDVKQPGSIKLTDLIPGEYAIRIWEDRNKNGLPDLTDLANKREAEAYTSLTKKVLIRANWEVQLQPTWPTSD